MTAKSVLHVQLKKLHPSAIVPKFQTAGAAGFDLHAIRFRPGLDAEFYEGESYVLAPGKSTRIHTGIAVSINNPDWGLFLFSRSGLGSKGIRLANGVGVIDSDYQGELLVTLRNDSADSFTINHGDRIAQGVFMPVSQAMFIEVDRFDTVTARGTGGFGSTGVDK